MFNIKRDRKSKVSNGKITPCFDQALLGECSQNQISPDALRIFATTKHRFATTRLKPKVNGDN